MRRLFVCIFSLVWVVGIMAQANTSKPYWIKKLPRTSRWEMYYYRMTKGEATNYEEAYAAAFAKAVQESKWKMGVSVDINENDASTDVVNSLTIHSSQVRLLLNKVCEYVEKNPLNMNVQVYVLWQVARYANVDPEFDDFDRCE